MGFCRSDSVTSYDNKYIRYLAYQSSCTERTLDFKGIQRFIRHLHIYLLFNMPIKRMFWLTWSGCIIICIFEVTISVS